MLLVVRRGMVLVADIVLGRVFRAARFDIFQHAVFESRRVIAGFEDVILMINKAEEVAAARLEQHLLL